LPYNLNKSVVIKGKGDDLMGYRLTSRIVTLIFSECLIGYQEEDQATSKIEGITMAVVFHTGRLNARRGDIIELLAELPVDFQQSGGGGMSFLNACLDKNGVQWTDLHQVIEKLFLLGMAIGKVTCLAPQREAWTKLPGGMPYYVVLN